MGYKPTVRIVKTRRTATLDGCSLCIDHVEATRRNQRAWRAEGRGVDLGQVTVATAITW
jgi:hypothetical protein